MTYLNKKEIINKMIFISPSTSLLDNPSVVESKKAYEYLLHRGRELFTDDLILAQDAGVGLALSLGKDIF